MSIVKPHIRQIGMMQAHCFKSNNPKGHRYFNYSSVEDYVLDRGVVAETSKGLTDLEMERVMKAASFSRLTFKPKECFHNAMMLTIHDRTNTIGYVEGYAYTGALPVPHAWNTINGKVVDLTRSLREEAVDEFIEGKPPQADLLDRVLGKIPQGWEYLGVEFTANEVLNYVAGREQTGSLINDYESGYPLFTEDRLGNSEAFDPDEWTRMKAMAKMEEGENV